MIVGPAHPYRGGIASFNERMASEFQNHGWKVTLVTFTLQYPSFLFPGKDQLHDGPAPENLTIYRKLNSINIFSWFRTASFIRKLKPDLVISHFWHPYLGPAIGNVLKNAKTKNISIVHNLYPHERKLGDNNLIRKFMSNTQKYIALSKKVQQDLRKHTQDENILLTPHPVYDNYGEKVGRTDALKELNLSTDFQYVLFFGLIRAYKGLDLLLDAFAKFNKQNKKVKLLVAGEFYEQQAKYLNQIDKLEIKNDVIFHDKYIANNRVKYYFSACDLVAQTYHRATQSGIMQIAIHFEKPMLVTNVGGLGEMIQNGKHGYVTEVNDNKIANALLDFFSTEKSQEVFSKELPSLKQKYSWQAFYKQIESFEA